MKSIELKPNRRILIVDDNPNIHADFQDILRPPDVSSDAAKKVEAALFDEEEPATRPLSFEMDSAFQGQEALAMVEYSMAENRPYALAFVDVRMPPGWDGIETIARIWKVHPDLQIVVCTAYSDYSWEQMRAKVGQPDSLLILKKPFETVEVVQMAHALTEKWRLHQGMKLKMTELEGLVAERTEALRETNATLEASNAELKASLATIKNLEGLLPICSHCKKIRDEGGGWNQIELYIRDHSNANFSHGICPECARELYPQFVPPSGTPSWLKGFK